ncbi:hypothetical protein LSAT2_002110 [Lamellibrachia satsuma]|nr:hypothetical protein LSAT2_002110 [Lamellibrachia satsuma]
MKSPRRSTTNSFVITRYRFFAASFRSSGVLAKLLASSSSKLFRALAILINPDPWPCCRLELGLHRNILVYNLYNAATATLLFRTWYAAAAITEKVVPVVT